MDEFLSIEDLRWEFGASRAWMYKYLAPHIKSITVKCSTDDGERLCKRLLTARHGDFHFTRLRGEHCGNNRSNRQKQLVHTIKLTCGALTKRPATLRLTACVAGRLAR